MSNPLITVVPLVPNLALPHSAPARTRFPIPAGYGVQEQCLPFTAASGLGLLIASPISFGFCVPEEAPDGCRTFRSPLERPSGAGTFSDPRVFYVFDNPECSFLGNAYHFEGIPVDGSPTILEPGISFFDRPDQQHLFKLHLPYVWRTPESVDTLFLPLLNRAPAHGLGVQSGLVETDWYSSPVNLIIAKPRRSTHVVVGDPVAHAILINRSLRKVALQVAASHSRLNRETRRGLAEWDKKHAKDRHAYKIMARDSQDSLEPSRAKRSE